LDRRTYPRFPVSFPVCFRVDVLGAQFLVSEFSSSGAILNISRNGMLAQVDRLLAVGSDCVISLVYANDLVWSHEVRGQVRRSSMGNGGWNVGIEFESLVDVPPQAAELSTAAPTRPA